MPSVILNPTQTTTSASIERTESGMVFLRAPAKTFPPFMESDAEKLMRDQGFQPATPEESLMIRAAIARTDAMIERQFAAT